MSLMPSAFRPRRWTFRGVLFSTLAAYILVCILFDMPLLSSKLPRYSGEYAVGVVDIEAPCEQRAIADAVFKKTRLPAFELETVLFSLYYPAVQGIPTRAPRHDWVPKPLRLTGEGYARFAKVNNIITNKAFTLGLWMLVGSTTIPANVDVPIQGTARSSHDYPIEQPLDEYGLPEFPVIVFSHGMASGRTSYTQWCGEMASRGYVVAAIEHRDGSGPATVIMDDKNKSRKLFPISPELLDPVPDMPDFKKMQLAMREAEVEETVKILQMLNNGRGVDVYKNNYRKEGQDLDAFKGRLNLQQVVLAGHSFGATLALQALKGAPSADSPFVGGVIMDPGKHSGPLNDDINVPIVIVHSESWSSKHTMFHGRPHFSVVKELVRKIIDEKQKNAWFTTAKGTTHPSVTDAPLIEPFLLAWTTGATIDAREGVLQYVKIARQFMRFIDTGHRQSILREEITHPSYNEEIRGYHPHVSKYWQIHEAPSALCPSPGYCGLEDVDDMDHD